MKIKLNRIIVIISILILVSACTNSEKSQQIDLEFECIDSFETFAFSKIGENEEQEPLWEILPNDHWEIEIELPSSTIQVEKEYYGVMASRNFFGKNEIWLRHSIVEGESKTDEILIYQVETQELRTFASTTEIENSGVYVSELFFLDNGEIWSNVWTDLSVSHEREVDSFPVLSKFNPETNHFEFAQSAFEFPLQSFDLLTSYLFPNVFYDDQEGVFWIIQSKYGIYRYDPIQEKTEHMIKLDEIVRDAVLSSEGGIYIVHNDIPWPPVVTFTEGDLLYYDIKLDSLSVITPPEEVWPSIETIAIDGKGNLWLDSNGWRTPEGEWQLVNTKFDEGSLANRIPMGWSTARHLFMSSNGYIWFSKSQNKGQYYGMAWYDPKTEEGCWFTSEISTIVEDADQNIWMIAHDKLYKLDLRP